MKVEEMINKVYECCSDSYNRHCDGCPVTDDCLHDKMPLFVLKYAIELLKQKQEMEERLKCDNCPYTLDDIGEFSDGYHTFNSLYTQRAVLFATIVNQNLDKAWKSHRHEDGEPCFGGGWFIVAVDTPKGSYSYHYEDKYWDIFKCVELPVAKHWDGHTDKDVWRLLLLS